MALYVMADLHLPFGIDKPMDIFGAGWANYVERLEYNWQSAVSDDDTVIIPGDFSWATYLEQSKRDFEFLNALNGRKILLKGNHDYWWSTMNKLKLFIKENGFENIEFMQNNAMEYNGTALCGTRGWLHPSWEGFGAEDRKIFDREVLRMELSLKDAEKRYGTDVEKYVFMHYPPTSGIYAENDMTRLFAEFNVKKVFYGHLHGAAHRNSVKGEYDGVEYALVSADYLQFMPKKIA